MLAESASQEGKPRVWRRRGVRVRVGSYGYHNGRILVLPLHFSFQWAGRAPRRPSSRSGYHARDRCALSEILPGKLFICNFKGAEDGTLREKRRCMRPSVPVCGKGDDEGFQLGQRISPTTSTRALRWPRRSVTCLSSTREHERTAFSAIALPASAQRDGRAWIPGVQRPQPAQRLLVSARRRTCIWPNEGFMAALIELEVEVRGGAPTITTEEYDRKSDWDGEAEEGDDAPTGTGGGGGMMPLDAAAPQA